MYRAKKVRGWPKGKDARMVPLSAKALEIVKRRMSDRDLRQPCGVEHMRNERYTNALVS